MQTAVELHAGGLTLRGMLHKPDRISGKVPVVAIFHGFTGVKTEAHFVFVKLSRLLEKKGIASVRFDFGGSGESDGDFFDMTISKELADAKAILAYIKALPFADAERIGIVGLSMGGVIASLLAGDCREDVRALCLWAPARNMRQLYLARDSRAGDLSGISEDEKEALIKRGYKDQYGLALSTDYLFDAEALDLVGRAAAFDKNVLIVHGGGDQVVPIENSSAYMEAYGSRAKFLRIEGADHVFSSISWETELLEHTTGFLTKELL
jgi:alpha/beta superfamily hydrolase